MLEDGRKKQEETERKNRDRKIRVERKARLEAQWEMLRWIVDFIDENKDRWERDRKEREERSGQTETKATWSNKTREERKDILREDWKKSEMTEKERWKKYRSVGAPKQPGTLEIKPGEMEMTTEQEGMPGLSETGDLEDIMSGRAVVEELDECQPSQEGDNIEIHQEEIPRVDQPSQMENKVQEGVGGAVVEEVKECQQSPEYGVNRAVVEEMKECQPSPYYDVTRN